MMTAPMKLNFRVFIFQVPKPGADFGQWTVLEIAQQNGFAIGLLEPQHRLIENGTQFVPVEAGHGIEQERLHGLGLLFMRPAARFSANGFGSGKMRTGVKPPRQDRAARKGAGFAGEVGENRLRDILRQVGVAID